MVNWKYSKDYSALLALINFTEKVLNSFTIHATKALTRYRSGNLKRIKSRKCGYLILNEKLIFVSKFQP
jgi:hypothetical protein